MRHLALMMATIALLAAACTTSTDEGVATLDEGTPTDSGRAAGDERPIDDEGALLSFAQCMRDNGVEAFPDPIVAENGVDFSIGGAPAEAGDGPFGVDPKTARTAFEACGEHLEGLAFGPGGGNFDPSEIQDQLVEFAACLRNEGIEVDDPDFSNFGPPGDGDGGDEGDGAVFVSPFGADFDPTDPEVQAAIEVCSEDGGGFGFRGGGPGRPPDGGEGDG